MRVTEDERKTLKAKFRRASDDHATDAFAYMEQGVRLQNAGADDNKKGNKTDRCLVYIESVTVASPDPDGLYTKSAIDGLCEAGLLSGDDRKRVAAVIVRQYQTNNKASETTRITLAQAPPEVPQGECWIIFDTYKAIIESLPESKNV